jgi:Phosducin
MTDSLAREEADKFFSNKDRITTHPEDALGSEDHSDIEEKNSSKETYHSDPGDDEDTLHNMSATTTATYHLPRTFFDANTGPKGVIADAQSFNRAKKHSLRNTIINLTNGSYFQSSSKSQQSAQPIQGSDSSEKSASGPDEDEDDFMERWRQNRLKELTAGASHKQRRMSPTKRKWGFFKEVDANEYLDVVEKTPSDSVVVVCIYDPEVYSGPRSLCRYDGLTLVPV